MSKPDKANDAAPRVPANAPPKEFRKRPGLTVKLEALLRHGPVLDAYGNRVTDLSQIQWDHSPPIQQRIYCEFDRDTIPAANDPEFIIPRAIEAHQDKTTKKDIPEIAKTKRLSDEQREFRNRILAKTADDLETRRKRPAKRKIPSRPFPQSEKQKQRSARLRKDLND